MNEYHNQDQYEEASEFAYVVPASVSLEDWDSVPHLQRMRELQALSTQLKDISVLHRLRDDLKYYASIRTQINNMMSFARISEPRV